MPVSPALTPQGSSGGPPVPPRTRGAVTLKLAPPQQRQICRWIGEFVPATVISQYAQKEWGISITPRGIQRYCEMEKWKPLIRRYRDEYLSQQGEVPLFHQRIRFQRLEDLYQEIAKHDSKSYSIQRLRRQELLGVLDLARKEIEGMRKAGDTNYISVTFNNLSDQELIQRRTEILEKLKLIHLTPTQEGADPDGQDEEGISTEQGNQEVKI